MAIEDFATLNLRMNTKDFDQGVSRGLSGLQSLSAFATKALALTGFTLGARRIVQFGQTAVQAAAIATEEFQKFGAVFDENAEVAQRTALEIASSFQLAESTSKSLLAATGDLLSGFKFTDEAALELSKQVVSLSADLASFTNFEGGTERASIALTKALLGETESAKSLGIVIRQDSLEFKRLVKEGQELEGLTLLQAKAMASLEIAVSQSTNAIGDFARTQDSTANLTRRVDEAWKSFTETVGESIIVAIEFDEILSTVSSGVKDATNFIKEINPNLRNFAVRASILAGAIGILATGVFVLRDAIRLRNVVLNRGTVSTIANTTATISNTASINANALSQTRSVGSIGKVAGALGKVGSIGAAAFIGWQIGRTINELTGLDEVLTDVFGNWFFNNAKAVKQGEDLDAQIQSIVASQKKARDNRIAVLGPKEEPETDFQRLKREKEIKKLKEETLKIEEAQFQFAFRRADVEGKLALLRQSLIKNVESRDSDRVKFAQDRLAIREIEATRVDDIAKSEIDLEKLRFSFALRRAKTEEKIALIQRKQNELQLDFFDESDPLKRLEIQKKLLQSESDLSDLATEQREAERRRAVPRKETSVVDAVQKGSIEAVKLANTTLRTESQIEKNTRDSAKQGKQTNRLLERIASRPPTRPQGIELVDVFQ